MIFIVKITDDFFYAWRIEGNILLLFSATLTSVTADLLSTINNLKTTAELPTSNDESIEY